jgi:hypothetical protein
MGNYYPEPGGTAFRWKEIKEPLMMGMNTTHEKKVTSWLGYNGQHLIHIKAALFKVNDKNVVFGYAWDWGDKFGDKQQRFKKGEEMGDQAIGCNAIATTLNSLTREFPQARQYCYTSTNAGLRDRAVPSPF